MALFSRCEFIIQVGEVLVSSFWLNCWLLLVNCKVNFFYQDFNLVAACKNLINDWKGCRLNFMDVGHFVEY
jgi:hypothetical protein